MYQNYHHSSVFFDFEDSDMNNQQRFESVMKSLMQTDSDNLSDYEVNDCSSGPTRSELVSHNGSAPSTLLRPLRAADFQSRDSVQSLVHYYINANQGLRLQHELNVGLGESIPETSTGLNHYSMLSFDRNLSNCSRSNLRKQQLHISSQGRPETKNKTRVCWTADLHKKFVRSVDQLGGARKATPKAILNLMNCDGLTIFHVKSHLQKYRVAQLMSEATKEISGDQLDTETNRGLQIVDALKLQMDFQRLMYQQLESQKKLQLRIEEQGKQLRAMIQFQMRIK